MTKEIVISAEKERTRIAIVENGKLAELYIENPEHERTLGNIFLGRVRRIMPSIRAAFIDIGQKQDAFLHFSDLSDNLPELLTFLESDKPQVSKELIRPEHQQHRGRRRRPKHQARGGKNDNDSDNGDEANGGEGGQKQRKGRSKGSGSRHQRRAAQNRSRHKKDNNPKKEQGRRNTKKTDDSADTPLEQYLKREQHILVKIVKEPISNKGSRVSTDISLAGRFLVLVPLADYIAVSKKISSYKERRRLRTLAKSLVPDGFGVIVRTVAEGRNAKALDTDLRLLVDRWRRIEARLAEASKPPAVVHEDVNMASSVIRDLFSSDYDRVLIDDQRTYRNIKNYIQAVAPNMASVVKLHQGKKHVFEQAGIAGELQEAFESRVNLPSGGYLFIERTEAMHVVDVNSGRSGRGMKQEDNALKCNLEAARVIAKQVRLRDLGGIIVVDFIDLRDDRNRKKVYDELKKEFRKDRAVTKVLPMSDFGLVQITRQRLRPSITTYASPDGSSSGDEDPVEDKPSKPASKPPPDTKAHDEVNPPQRDRQSAEPRKSRGNGRRGGGGRGKRSSRSPDDLMNEIESWITDYKKKGFRRPLTLRVHPFTAAFLNRRVPTRPTRWFMKHFIRVRVQSDPALNPLSYRFVDPRSGDDVTNLDALKNDTGKTAA